MSAERARVYACRFGWSVLLQCYVTSKAFFTSKALYYYTVTSLVGLDSHNMNESTEVQTLGVIRIQL